MADSSIKPESRRPLESILTAGKFIVAWSRELNEHRLWADKLKRSAIERQFEVIAESLCRLRNLDPRTYHSLKDAETAMRLGEAIRRDFDAIDYGILWRATRRELPQMLQEVEDLLADSAGFK